MTLSKPPLTHWMRALALAALGILCLAAPAAHAARNVIDTERGGYFTYPWGNQWSRFGAEFGRTNFTFSAMPADSAKGLHGRFQHFAAVDDGPAGLAYFPWAEFVAYNNDEVAKGRPSLICTATYAGKKRPLYFAYTNYDPVYNYQPVNVRDDRFIKFWIKQYVRGVLGSTYYQNWWVGADNCTYKYDLYGVLDDSGNYIKNLTWDAPYPQNDTEWVDANLYMLRKIKEWAPNTRLILNDIGLNEANSYKHNDFVATIDGVLREDFWYLAGGSGDWYRASFFDSFSKTYYRGSLGKVEVYEVLTESWDSELIRRSWMAFLLFGGDNFFFGPKDSASREIDPALYADLRNRLGRPTGSMLSTQESGKTIGCRLYWRECEGGICYLNWTGNYKTVSLPAGRPCYDRFGNQISSISLGDMAGDCVYFSPTPRVSWPSINPRFAGAVSGPVTVKIDMDPAFGSGATMRYTIDGSDPTASSPTYRAPFTLWSSATVKARAFKSGMADSFVNSAPYTIVGTPAVEFHLSGDSGSEFLKADYPLVKLSNPSGQTVQVNYSVTGGSATAGSDYTLSSGTLTFPPGEQYRYFKLPIINDSISEPVETVRISLSSPVNAYIGNKGTYTYSIEDNDGGYVPPTPTPTPTPTPSPTPTPGGPVNFSALYGSWGGLLQTSSLSFAQAGNINLTLTTSSSFTASIAVGNKTVSTSGTFSSSGAWRGSLSGTNFVLALQIDTANANGKITGSLTDAGVKVADVLGYRRPLYTTSNPCPRAGKYTLVLPVDPAHPESSYPKGSGYANIVVSVSGSVWLLGQLGDTTSISCGASISAEGDVPFYASVYSGQGASLGWLTLRDASASNQVSGNVSWFKPTTSSTLYPGAFTGQSVVQGSIYVAPPTRPQILTSLGGYGSLSYLGGNISPSSGTTWLRVSNTNVVTSTNIEPFTFTYDTANGFFSGTFTDYARKIYTFRGAVLQKQNVGLGQFQGVNQTGSVTFKPSL